MTDLTELPPKVRELLEQSVFAHLSTIMADGSPQTTPVWVDTDGKHVIINTAEGRLKARNVRRNPNVALSIMAGADPYSGTLQIRGRVVEVTADGADEHIDRLVRNIWGVDKYPLRQPSEIRLFVKIAPQKLSGGILGT